MNKETLANDWYTLSVNDLISEIEVNHPLFAANLLLFVNSELFALSKEVLNLEHVIIITGRILIPTLLKEYGETKEKKYKKQLLQRYAKQEKNFSENLKKILLTYIAR